MKFEDYYNKNIITSGAPTIEFLVNKFKGKFDYIINVNDQFDEEIQQYCLSESMSYFWFPMNEHSPKGDIGLNSIFGALNILKLAHKNNQRVLIHCAAGANRSVTVKEAFHFMNVGSHDESKFKEDSDDFSGIFIFDSEDQKKKCKEYTKTIKNNMLLHNCYNGNLPSLPRMESFLKKLKDYDLSGNCLDELKINSFT